MYNVFYLWPKTEDKICSSILYELILNNINPPNFYPQVPPITLQSTHHISLHTWKLQSNETVTKKIIKAFHQIQA